MKLFDAFFGKLVGVILGLALKPDFIAAQISQFHDPSFGQMKLIEFCQLVSGMFHIARRKRTPLPHLLTNLVKGYNSRMNRLQDILVFFITNAVGSFGDAITKTLVK